RKGRMEINSMSHARNPKTATLMFSRPRPNTQSHEKTFIVITFVILCCLVVFCQGLCKERIADPLA
ncbi:MAG: hypothetical protein LBI18_10390, partial [Planctomycetaceae bacterium]|nr:hypothetical protein [Planctomycetaceae bacterium]